MRRTEREITDRAFMDQVLEDALEMYVAWNTPASPYVIPLNYVYYKDCLFFHCALEGRKLELLRSDPRVGFTTAVDIAVDGTTTRYRCVCGTGTMELVDDPALKEEVLRAFAARYDAPCRFPVSEKKFAATGVLRLTIETLSGKYSRRGEGKRPMPHYEF